MLHVGQICSASSDNYPENYRYPVVYVAMKPKCIDMKTGDAYDATIKNNDHEKINSSWRIPRTVTIVTPNSDEILCQPLLLILISF